MAKRKSGPRMEDQGASALRTALAVLRTRATLRCLGLSALIACAGCSSQPVFVWTVQDAIGLGFLAFVAIVFVIILLVAWAKNILRRARARIARRGGPNGEA